MRVLIDNNFSFNFLAYKPMVVRDDNIQSNPLAIIISPKPTASDYLNHIVHDKADAAHQS